jgi:hypothetical protein
MEKFAVFIADSPYFVKSSGGFPVFPRGWSNKWMQGMHRARDPERISLSMNRNLFLSLLIRHHPTTSFQTLTQAVQGWHSLVN